MKHQHFRSVAMAPTSPSRRELLRKAALLAGNASVVVIPGLPRSAFAANPDARHSASDLALELDRAVVATLQSADGGFARAEVINEAGPGGLVKKRLGPPRYRDIVIQLPLPVPIAVRDWIASTMSFAPQRRSGAILTYGPGGQEQQRLQFANAMVSEISFPSCDGSSKAAEYLTLRLACESTAPFAGSGAAPTAKSATPKAWMPGNFRLSIAGIDCSRVSKVEAFGVKLAAQQQGPGMNAKDTTAKASGPVEFSNLTMYVEESHAAGFYGWYQEMVIKGNSTDAAERQGSLELLDPSLKDTLQRVNFQNLGILDYSPVRASAGSENIKRVRVELYCERMSMA